MDLQTDPETDQEILERRRSRRLILILLGIFLAPILAAYSVFFLFPALRPTGTTNYGTLVNPARPLPALSLQDAGGQAPIDNPLKGRWSLVYVGGPTCDEACLKEIFLGRQVRTSLARDEARLRRVYIAPGAAALAAVKTVFADGQPDLRAYADAGSSGARAADFFQNQPANSLFLLDPLGNWLMVYPPQADQDKDFKGVLKDLKKLLNQSQID